eukprot:3584098-Rhodomonas_salina.1
MAGRSDGRLSHMATRQDQIPAGTLSSLVEYACFVWIYLQAACARLATVTIGLADSAAECLSQSQLHWNAATTAPLQSREAYQSCLSTVLETCLVALAEEKLLESEEQGSIRPADAHPQAPDATGRRVKTGS